MLPVAGEFLTDRCQNCYTKLFRFPDDLVWAPETRTWYSLCDQCLGYLEHRGFSFIRHRHMASDDPKMSYLVLARDKSPIDDIITAQPMTERSENIFMEKNADGTQTMCFKPKEPYIRRYVTIPRRQLKRKKAVSWDPERWFWSERGYPHE